MLEKVTTISLGVFAGIVIIPAIIGTLCLGSIVLLFVIGAFAGG